MAAQSAWQRYVQEGRDRTNATQAQIESFVNQMVKEGQVRAAEAGKAVDDIQARLSRQAAQTQKRIRGVITDELKRLGLATKSDVDRLERKVARLEKQLAGAGGAKKTAAAKKASPAKSTAKKAAAKKTAAKTPAKKATKRS